MSIKIIIKVGIKMEVIENIIKIMQEKGITAYKLEKEANINATTFYNWKNGKQPPADKLYKIITYLGVSPNEIFGYDSEISLTENEKELLEQFRKLPDREQIKFIGRLEEAALSYQNDSQQNREII